MILSSLQFPQVTNTVTGIDMNGELWFRNAIAEDSINNFCGIAEGPDNGLLLAGRRKFGLVFSMGIYHYDKYFQKLWDMNAAFPDPNEMEKFVLRTHDGNYMAMDGRQWSSESTQQRMVWFKPDGTQLRTKELSLTGQVHWQGIAETPDHGYILSGYNDAPGGMEWALAKLSEQGTVQWQYARDGERTMAIKSIVLDDGVVITCGQFIYAGVTNAMLMRTSATGQMEWEKMFAIQTSSSFADVIREDNGEYTLVGSSGEAAGPSHVILTRTDANGNILWTKHTNSEGWGRMLFKRSDGGYTILANTIDVSGFFVLVTDKDGNIE